MQHAHWPHMNLSQFSWWLTENLPSAADRKAIQSVRPRRGSLSNCALAQQSSATWDVPRLDPLACQPVIIPGSQRDDGDCRELRAYRLHRREDPEGRYARNLR